MAHHTRPIAPIYVPDLDCFKIPLPQGKFVLIDKEDVGRFARYAWSIGGAKKYICRRAALHREVLDVSDPNIHVDHIDGNKLDCRRSNLRACSNAENAKNRSKNRHREHGQTCSSKFKGVSWDKSTRHWKARIRVRGKLKHLGSHDNEIDAARAYDVAAMAIFGKFARTNSDLNLY